MIRVTVALSAGCVLLAGCSLAPDYARPALPIENQWPAAVAGADATTASDPGWRQFLSDARLRRLVELALEHNRDLRVATLNLEQVRARYRIASVAFIPSVEAGAAGTRSRISADDAQAGQAQTASHFSVGLDIPAYELDLFGRVRGLRDQALELFLASEEAQKSAHLALVAEVSNRYLAQRVLAEQLGLAEQTLKSVGASFQLAQKRYQVGTASRLDLATAETQVQGATADVSVLRQQLAQADNALVFLIGRSPPDDLPAPAPLGDRGLLADLSPGLPSDLLQRRPDLRQAEHELRAANANIGVVRAAFFPQISLTAAVGTASPELSRLFGAGTGTWSFSPRVTVPLFSAGRNRATLDVARLQKLVEVARYERAIQNAFREVSDALAVRAFIAEQIATYEALARTQQQRFTLAEARYRQGIDSYLAVLTAQRDLYAAQQALIRARFTKEAGLVALFRALGGGWTP